MKIIPHVACIGALVLLAAPLKADLFVSNFTTLDGTSGATGVWRNHTTSTDLALPVELSQTGGTVKPVGNSSTGSRTDDSFPWQDVPAVNIPPFITPGIDVFEPNFDGDFINVETQEGTTTTVTLNFNAMVTDPIISFTDVEYRTTITFPSAFTVLASTSNLSTTSTTLTSDRSLATGDNLGIFGQEAAGSIQFSGTFDKIVFTVAVAVGDAGVGDEDRTGYVVSTMTEPTPLAPASAPLLNIEQNADNITLSWTIGDFGAIQIGAADTLSGWTAIPGLDPMAVSSWTGSIATLGDKKFFRGLFPD